MGDMKGLFLTIIAATLLGAQAMAQGYWDPDADRDPPPGTEEVNPAAFIPGWLWAVMLIGIPLYWFVLRKSSGKKTDLTDDAVGCGCTGIIALNVAGFLCMFLVECS